MHKPLSIIALISLCQAICTDTLNGCVHNFNENSWNCMDFMCSGSCQCICTNGCADVQTNVGRQCKNLSKSFPVSEMVYPQYCNKNPELIDTDVECNIFGKGTYCPYGCRIVGDTCQSDGSYVCEPKVDWVCPFNCKYDRQNNTCVPNFVGVVCNLIPPYYDCPTGCQLDVDTVKCIGDPQTVCELKQQLVCPKNCKLNILLGGCIDQIEKRRSSICYQSSTPKCPGGCVYDNNMEICWSPKQICEPIVNMYCEYGSFNNTPKMAICNQNTYQEICTTYEKTSTYTNGYVSDMGNYFTYNSISYPKYKYGYTQRNGFVNIIEYSHITIHLKDKLKYNNIQCDVSYEGNCENKRVKHECCL